MFCIFTGSRIAQKEQIPKDNPEVNRDCIAFPGFGECSLFQYFWHFLWCVWQRTFISSEFCDVHKQVPVRIWENKFNVCLHSMFCMVYVSWFCKYPQGILSSMQIPIPPMQPTLPAALRMLHTCQAMVTQLQPIHLAQFPHSSPSLRRVLVNWNPLPSPTALYRLGTKTPWISTTSQKSFSFHRL